MVAKTGIVRSPTSDSSRNKNKILVILDVNGVLLLRNGTKKQNVKLRAHLDVLLSTLDKLKDRVIVGVWSSMMEKNLYPALHGSLGQERTDSLAFVFDQVWCTQTRIKGMKKPLLRKDLVWLKQTWFAGFMPNRVLLIDDDPIKCTQNPPGTAIHPSSFTGQRDDELLALSAYLEDLANSGCASVPEYILANPYIPCGGELEISDADSAREDSHVEQEQEEAEQWPDDEMHSEFIDSHLPSAKRARTGNSLFQPGDSVEAYWPDDDTWCKAQVICIQSDGDVQIMWEPDGLGSTVPEDYLRLPKLRHACR